MGGNQKQPKIFVISMYIGGIAIMLMMILTVIDVVLKSFFDSAIPGNYLFMESYLMPIAVFLGMPYAFFSGIFPRLDMFLIKWKASTRLKVIIAMLVLELIAFLVLIYYSFTFGIYGAVSNITFLAGVNSYPLYPMFFLVTIAFTMITIYLIKIIWNCLKTGEEPLFFSGSEN